MFTFADIFDLRHRDVLKMLRFNNPTRTKFCKNINATTKKKMDFKKIRFFFFALSASLHDCLRAGII